MTIETDDNVVPVEELNRRRRVSELCIALAAAVQDAGAAIGQLRQTSPTDEWVHLAIEKLPALNKKLGERSYELAPALVGFFLKAWDDRMTSEDGGSFAAGLASAMLGDGGFAQMITPLLEMFGRRTFATEPHPAPFAADADIIHAMSPDTIRIKHVIERLFAEAPKLTAEDGTPRDDQAPALECMLVLKSGMQVAGSLSVTPEGTLRLLMLNQRTDRGMAGAPVMTESFFDYDQVSMITVKREVTLGQAPDPSPIIHTS